METPCNGNPFMETIFEKTRNYHLWKPILKNKACLSKINSVFGV
jgi:hypothetical protein